MYKSAGLDAKSIEEKVLDLLNSNIILQNKKIKLLTLRFMH